LRGTDLAHIPDDVVTMYDLPPHATNAAD